MGVCLQRVLTDHSGVILQVEVAALLLIRVCVLSSHGSLRCNPPGGSCHSALHRGVCLQRVLTDHSGVILQVEVAALLLIRVCVLSSHGSLRCNPPGGSCHSALHRGVCLHRVITDHSGVILQLEVAARLFTKAQKWLSACRCYERMDNFRQAVRLLDYHELYDEAIDSLKRYDLHVQVSGFF